MDQHGINVYVTDLPAGRAALYLAGLQHVEVSERLTPFRRRAALQKVMALGQERCLGCMVDGETHEVIPRLARRMSATQVA